MSITVTLNNNSSPVEKIGKSLSAGENYSCLLKEGTSILRPTLIIAATSNLANYNYMYISDFSRYYFIDDVVSLHHNLWEVSGHVDVLETYATQIKANTAVIRRQEKRFNLYLDDPEFIVYNNYRIQTKKFKGASGWTKTLHYVLVVNGDAANNNP